MALHTLTAAAVEKAAKPLLDGGGLELRISAKGASWVLRYTFAGRRRAMGLGPAHRDSRAAAGESLAQARKAAQRARDLLAAGVDPVAQRDAEREAAAAAIATEKAAARAQAWTLARAARDYHERVIEPQLTAKHSAQWISSLENNVPPALWHKPIDSIKPPELLEALAALRLRIPETCDRVRQRLEKIFADAAFFGHCTTNPAAIIRYKLSEAPRAREEGHFRALAYSAVPALMAELAKRPGTAAHALRFAVLCAARTSEVLGAATCAWVFSNRYPRAASRAVRS